MFTGFLLGVLATTVYFLFMDEIHGFFLKLFSHAAEIKVTKTRVEIKDE